MIFEIFITFFCIARRFWLLRKTSVHGTYNSLWHEGNIDQWYLSIPKYCNIIGCLNKNIILWHTNNNKIRTTFHGAHAMSHSLLKIISYPSVKKRRKNYSSADIDKAITNIQAGDITRTKAVCGYGIPRQTLARKCKNEKENVAEKMPCSLPVLGETSEKDLVQWSLATQKQGLPMGRETVIKMNSEINRYMFVSVCSVWLVGPGWCDQFRSWHGKLTFLMT